MSKLIHVISAIILLTSFFLDTVSSELHESKDMNAYAAPPRPAGVWFGPRLGRKKRNPSEEYFKTVALEGLADSIEDSPWSLVAVNDGKRRVGYTPRLGREIEDMFGEDSGPEDYLFQRHVSFIPRLGRQLMHLPH